MKSSEQETIEADSITSTFITASDEGIKNLQFLTAALAREKFTHVIPEEVLEQYISENFNRATLIVEMNSLSNQWIAVYVNNEPAGYARVTSKGRKPQTQEHKKIIRLADFGVLQKYNAPEIVHALLDKCLSVCRKYDGIWINEYPENRMITFFESVGFAKLNEVPGQFELPLTSVYFFSDKKEI